MRKLIIGLLWAFLCCNLYGQQLRRDFMQEVAFGVNGGLNFSKVSFLHNMNDRLYELGNQSFVMGTRFGFTTRYIHRNHFGIQLEVNYVQAGWQESFHENIGYNIVNGVDMQDVKLGRRLDYIDVPVLAHIYFGKRRLKFVVNLGPELRVMTKYNEVKWNIPDGDPRQAVFGLDDPRFKDEYKGVDYGLCGGGGFDVTVAKRLHLLAEFRYAYGFGDIYGNKKSDLFQRSNNQMFGVTLSVLYTAFQFKESRATIVVE